MQYRVNVALDVLFRSSLITFHDSFMLLFQIEISSLYYFYKVSLNFKKTKKLHTKVLEKSMVEQKATLGESL